MFHHAASLWAMAVCAMALASPGYGQSIDLGLTGDIKDGEIGGAIGIQSAPVFDNDAGLSGAWAVAARADGGGNAWVGGGFALTYALSDRTFIEASFMPGYYAEGDRDLGGALQFRSLVGIGYGVSPRSAVIVSLDHFSNANTQSFNPGTETVALSWRVSF